MTDSYHMWKLSKPINRDFLGICSYPDYPELDVLVTVLWIDLLTF